MNYVLSIIDWFNVNQGFSMVLLTAVYVLATILLVRQSRRANRIAQQNLESLWKLERERSRPVERRYPVRLERDSRIPFWL